MRGGPLAAVVLASTVAAAAGCNLIVGSYAVGDAGTSNDDAATVAGDSGSHGEASQPAPAGRIGDPCTSNASCTQAGTTCNGTSCVASCTTSATCGNNSAGTPNVCVEKICLPGCATTADCSGYSGTTCQQLVAGTGMVCGPTPTTGGMIGDPCATSAGCAQGQCNGSWCGEKCAPSMGCGTNTAGQQNFCVTDSNNNDICFPGCLTTSDCSAYPGNLTCQQQTPGVSVCAAPAGNIGDPCSASLPCTQGSCMPGIPWCTTSCTASGTTCGSASSGEANYCIQNAKSEFVCFPGCTTGGDCSAYAGTTCQPIAGGGPGSVCSAPPGGHIGDPCTITSDCTEGTCESGIPWCTSSCTVDADCLGQDSAGQPTYCVQNTNGQLRCFPGCTTDSECSAFPTLTCQPITTEAGSICSG